MSFDLNAVMDGLGVRLKTIAGLRVHDYPPDSVAVPAAIVDFPEGIEYHPTYGVDSASAVFPVYVLVGQVSDRASRDAIAPYANPAGDQAVLAAIEADPTLGGAAQSLQVQRSDFTKTLISGGVEYLAVRFDVEVYA